MAFYNKGQWVPHGRAGLCKQIHRERVGYYEVSSLDVQDIVNFFLKVEAEILDKLGLDEKTAEVKVTTDHWQKVATFTVYKKGIGCQKPQS